MCGFRNIAIHEYQNLDIKILQSILEKELVGLEKYYLSVLEFLDGEADDDSTSDV